MENIHICNHLLCFFRFPALCWDLSYLKKNIFTSRLSNLVIGNKIISCDDLGIFVPNIVTPMKKKMVLMFANQYVFGMQTLVPIVM
jgi:hypothetical protein